MPLSKPWEPVSKLHIEQREPGKRYRFCRKDILKKRMAEGWKPVQLKPTGPNVKTTTLQQGESVDGTVQVENLILCEMPEEMAESRNEYFRKLTDPYFKKEGQLTLMEKEAAGSSGLVYGKGIQKEK